MDRMKKMNTLNHCDTQYAVVLPRRHDPDLYIKWNINAFISGEYTTGFIVQHMSIRSNVSSLKDEDYWECWHIKDGILENQRGDYDDKWSPIFPAFIECCEKEILSSPDGIVRYSAQVYWIPDFSDEYKIINQWKPIMGGPAGDLPMVYQIDCDVNKFYRCTRFYEWNYKNELAKIKRGDYSCDT